ncbi:uncharacterized protein LOC131859194 [Cryptomeria japonica]|uniref:uncharacterized protein LOC131859194 n=1 Tax=Cryptomeria japonica TaxID=3369 RepID=UPI0027DA35A1|nr:uncharacterized protein LOC131859194 [Cryptomeria japonica]
MVDKLGLTKSAHPFPYHVSWLTKGQQTLVTYQTMVEFSLGDFKDKVLCDIVEMDAFHLLLGRPWKYDMDATYSCRKNTYTMKPLPDTKAEKEPIVIVIGEKEMVKTLKESQEESFVLVVKPKDKDESDCIAPIPDVVKGLLDKYKEVNTSELPSTLPPLRDVCHQIDLIPGASLPNKAPYKMTPNQNTEISRQVHEMLNKGLIQKSLSPCAVPAVLAPKKYGKWRLFLDYWEVLTYGFRLTGLLPFFYL